ncbi:condensation protein [Gordonia sp. CPCC 205515]|uniref:condensation protein n=1 Tax=Gordonia sp. CPCC 205515 TaxID=3140791 RepID=UPI003AF3E867
MKLCSVDDITLPSGELIRWTLRATGPGRPSDATPSENETFHLDSVRRTGRSGWLAIAVEIPGWVQVTEITRGIRAVLDRHEILRTHFVTDAAENHQRMLLGPDAVAVEAQPGVSTLAPTDQVFAEIASGCSPFEPLGHHFAAIRTPSSTTLVCAFDHVYVDAYSLGIIASNIFDGLGGRPIAAADSFLDLRRTEQTAPPIGPDDPRLAAWGRFFTENDWQVPEFPLDLGVAPGETAPARTDVRTLLTAAQGRAFERAVHTLDARTFPALLTGLAAAVHDCGGPLELPVVIPVHLRRSHSSRRSVGWIVGNAPMTATSDGSAGSAMRTTTRRLGAALPLAEIGVTPVYTTYAAQLKTTRHDVFMASYIDYRQLKLPRVRVHHISSGRQSDTAQWWFWRDDDGIHLRARFPDTQIAADTMSRVLDALNDFLIDIPTTGGAARRTPLHPISR